MNELDFANFEYAELCGWDKDSHGVAIQSWGQSAGELWNTGLVGDKQRTMLWELVRKVIGGDTPNYAQLRGDCVSFGAKNVVEYLQCVQMALGQRESFKLIFPPYIYGISRVQIGGGRLWGDGSNGVWAAQGVMKYGVLSADAPNCPKYSKQISGEWGASGPPDEFITLGKEHLIKSTAQVRTWDDLKGALSNGYPVTVASNVGYDMSPRSDGFNHYSTSWSHQMCATPDTIISYVNFKLIPEVKVGDIVQGHDGQQHVVTQTFERDYNGELIKIKSFGHEPIRLTPNHPVLVEREVFINKDNEEETHNGVMVSTITKVKKVVKKWINASSVKLTDCLIIPKSGIYHKCEPLIPEYTYKTNQVQAKQLPLLTPDKDTAWLLGLFAADGSINDNAKVVITLNSNETDKANRAAKVLNSLGIKTKIKPVKNKNAIRVVGYSTILAKSFSSWFNKRENKQVPDWIFYGWDIKSVIDGVFDGDGCYINNNHTSKRINNTSRKLAYQVYHMLLELGYVAKLTIKNMTKASVKNARVQYVVEWSEINRSHKLKNRKDYIACPIRSIEQEYYIGKVYNFEVEGCHSYIANGITVHNCIVGYDDGDNNIEPHGCILNSWGDIFGHIKDFRTGVEWPIGTIRARKRDIEIMLNAGDSWAYSGFDGFPAQLLPESYFDMLR